MFRPISIDTSEGQTILDAALSSGIPLFHVCGGKAKCSTCRSKTSVEEAKRICEESEKYQTTHQTWHGKRNMVWTSLIDQIKLSNIHGELNER